MYKNTDYENLFTKGIVLIQPSYEKGLGDTTRVVLENSEVFICKNIKTVIKNLAKTRFLDLEEERRYFKQILGKNRNLPLAYDKNYIFLPVKTRFPIGKNDGAMSFVNVRKIEKAKDGMITFDNGTSLYTYTSDRTMKGLLKDAKLIAKDFSRD